MAEEAKLLSEQMEEHQGIQDDTMEIVEKSKAIFKKIDNEFETVISCN